MLAPQSLVLFLSQYSISYGLQSSTIYSTNLQIVGLPQALMNPRQFLSSILLESLMT